MLTRGTARVTYRALGAAGDVVWLSSVARLTTDHSGRSRVRGVETDVTAIACPVYSQARIVAALSLVIPSYRLTASQAMEYGRMLVSATADVSARLSRSPKASLPEGPT